MIKINDCADSTLTIETDAALDDNTMAKLKELISFIYETRYNNMILAEATDIVNNDEDEGEE